MSAEPQREFLLSQSGMNLFKSDRLLYRLDLGYMPGMPQKGIVYKPEEHDWDAFWNSIESIGVFSWNDSQDWPLAFPEREGAAGCGVPSLGFVIHSGEKLAVCKGASNRFPPNWNEFWRCVEKLFEASSELLDQAELGKIKGDLTARWNLILNA